MSIEHYVLNSIRCICLQLFLRTLSWVPQERQSGDLGSGARIWLGSRVGKLNSEVELAFHGSRFFYTLSFDLPRCGLYSRAAVCRQIGADSESKRLIVNSRVLRVQLTAHFSSSTQSGL